MIVHIQVLVYIPTHVCNLHLCIFLGAHYPAPEICCPAPTRDTAAATRDTAAGYPFFFARPMYNTSSNQPSLLQHPQPQTSVCLRATAPPPPPLFGCYRPISPAALAPVASGRGRRSPICREDLEGSPLCPQPKKSVWLLFFSPTGFFLGLPQPTRKIASLRTLPLSGLRLYVVAVEQPEPSS